MTEQYRNGSDDDDDFFLPRQHTAMKRISFFLSPFPITISNTTTPP